MAFEFSKEQKDKIKKAIAAAEETLKDIEKAKRAGIDVSEQEKSITDSLKQLRQIKQVYFPTE
jgi:hypothetical protein